MSFELLKNEIIDAGFCQGCGKCAGRHARFGDGFQ